jgi:hypothetical protein
MPGRIVRLRTDDAPGWIGRMLDSRGLRSGRRLRRRAIPDAPTHFVSYPKSGRTWVRYVLRLLEADRAIAFHHDGFDFSDGSRPEHDFDLETRRRRYRGRTLVYMRRDPRDVLVSLYFQVTGRFDDIFGYRGTIAEFIRDPYFGAAPLHRFTRLWTAVLAERPGLVLAYEEMSADPAGQTARLLEGLGIARPAEVVARAVEAASFEAMRAVERSGEFPEPWLRLRNEAPKVREGKVGGHRAALAQADIEYLDAVFGVDAPADPPWRA